MSNPRFGSALPDIPPVSAPLSWWSRVRRALVRAFGPPEPSVVPLPPMPAPKPVLAVLSQRRDLPELILVPSRGDAFDFQVQAALTWTAHQMSQPEFALRVDKRVPWAAAIVREEAARAAREYLPHQAHHLEVALNHRFAELTPRDPDDMPRFSARVWVRPDDRVRDRLRPYWEERIRLECEHELNKLRAAQADELTRRWRDVFDGLERELVSPHAAQLAGERFAKVFGEFVKERRRVVPDLVTLLEQAVKGNELVMGPLEYTEAWDLALQTYRRQHGLVDAG